MAFIAGTWVVPAAAEPAASPKAAEPSQSPTQSASQAAPSAIETAEGAETIVAPDLALGADPESVGENASVEAPTLAAPEASQAPSPASTHAPDVSPELVTVDVRVLPKRVPYRNEMSMPGYVLDERPRWWLTVGGGASFVGGYIAGLAVASNNDFDHGTAFAAIPVAGPWIAAFRTDGCTECDRDVRQTMVVAGLFQTLGAILLPIGVYTTRKVWLREDLALTVRHSSMGHAGQGLLVSGSF